QLARSLFLTLEKSLRRKLKEIILAIRIERAFSKQEILEMYLNQVCYGHGAYGVEAAAQLYYGKHVWELNLPQCALLAALPRRPAYYSPFEHPGACRKRRNLVLDKMAEEGFITRAEAERAKRMPINEGLVDFKQLGIRRMRAHYFTNFAIRELVQRFGSNLVYKGGLRVYTTLDIPLQIAAHKIIAKHYRKQRWRRIDQMALVCIEIKTGRILAMVGGVKKYRRDPKTGRLVRDDYNRATQAPNQPGSSFKPYVYAAALEFGFKPYSIFDDSRISFVKAGGAVWSPRNYDGIYGRSMTLKRALAMSNNVIAVKVCRAVGVDRVVETAKRMGFRFVGNPYIASYALALGAVDGYLLYHTSALSCIANGGLRVPPTTILSVYNREGNLIYKHTPRPIRVLAPEVAEQLLDMMMAVVTSGTGRRARVKGYQIAGKTGTSSERRDLWFLGFSPSLACGIWAGREDNKPLNSGSGGAVCAPIFSEFMTVALKHRPGPKEFTMTVVKSDESTQRQNLVKVKICDETGLLATSACPSVHEELLPRNQAPKVKCSLHRTDIVEVAICTASGKLAGFYCPPELIVWKRLPAIAVPVETCPVHRPRETTVTSRATEIASTTASNSDVTSPSESSSSADLSPDDSPPQ
ncbi:MAG TPA: hypothetical protein EYP10_12420, partial [Armatimonadetes bacterium]|nr:hypothetical protein [Armatimonadota bacterium]